MDFLTSAGVEALIDMQSSPEYLGLKRVPGIVSLMCPSLPEVACPFCSSIDVAFLMGKVGFSVTMGGDDLFGGVPQNLVAVVCAKSHIFFLREKDALRAK
ncbi:MAG TPA: hypothetical protein VK579_19270 [Terriglobales bacterium]|nr:hypothetical protein [Terriglobales bacterium]